MLSLGFKNGCLIAEPQGQLLTSEDQRMLERWKKMAQPKAIQPKLNPEQQNGNVIVVIPATTHSFLATNVKVTQSFTPHQLPINQGASNSTARPSIMVQPTSFSSQQPQSEIPQQPFRTFTDIASMHMLQPQPPITDTFLDNGHEDSFYDNPLFSDERLQQPVNQNENTSLSGWTNEMPLNTSLDISALTKLKPQVCILALAVFIKILPDSKEIKTIFYTLIAC